MSGLRVDGAVVFWTLGEWTSRDALAAGWAVLGPEWGRLAPPPRTRLACLRDAMAAVWPKYLIRPLSRRDGFAVLVEQRMSDEVVTVCKYAAKVDDLGRVDIVRGHDVEAQERLRAEHARQEALLKPSQVATSLVAALANLPGPPTRIRPTGGIYWVPQGALDTWEALAGVVERASVGGRNSVYRITHTFDGDSIRAVRDALLGQVEADAQALVREIDAGDLGERGLKTRALQAERLRAQVEEYERILGERLPDARAVAETAATAAMAARLLATTAAVA